jgi:hypothetical protein
VLNRMLKRSSLRDGHGIFEDGTTKMSPIIASNINVEHLLVRKVIIYPLRHLSF